ncbi:MAG: sensor histidine kinase [Paracoccaceae bacterium]|nr:sensor histidine kinase [Paracoccaceae bacterium]
MNRLSLRARLFLLLVVPLVVVAMVASAARYVMAERLSRQLYDNTLLAVALTISRDVVLSEGDILTEQLLDALTRALGDPVYYRITGPEGSFVTGYSEPPVLPEGVEVQGGAPYFYDSTAQGRPVRAVVLREFIAEPQYGGWVTVEVWQTVTQRAALSLELLTQSIFLLGTLVLTAAVFLWFGISLGLRPLLQLREAIGARSPDDLRPIRRWVPPELRNLVEATNSLFARLTEAFSLRDAFISDAAHQMRNPIAAIQTQAEAALTAPNEAALRGRVAELAETARQTGRLTHQLLSMERVRGRRLRNLLTQTDVAAVVGRVVRRFAEGALRRDIAVSLTVKGAAHPILGDAVLIEEMLINVLDNAAAYGVSGGPAVKDVAGGGEIAVTLQFGGQGVTILVADDGPGIAPALHDRVFDRFFRVSQDTSSGCGLGLAIVRNAAEAHGGAACIRPSAHGTCVEIWLPSEGVA